MDKIMLYLRRIKLINLNDTLCASKSISIKTGKNTFILFFDIIFCCIKFGATAQDYDRLGFALIKNDMRSTYLTEGVNNEIISSSNSLDIIPAFKCRTDFYLMYSEYIKREFINIEKVSKEIFVSFLKNNEPVVLKNNNYSDNSDIRVMNLSDEKDYYSLFNRFSDDGHTIVEQYISMNSALREYSTKSLNRLKITTYCKNSVVYILRSMLCLDETAVCDGDGKVRYVFVNDEGFTYTEAIDNEGKITELNPVTGTSYRSFKIPLYKKAVSLAKELALFQNEIQFAEWTIAVGEDEPFLVDATANPSLVQPTNDLARGENGILSEYRKYISLQL